MYLGIIITNVNYEYVHDVIRKKLIIETDIIGGGDT
jgi:hypothetical protein